jgi:quercetin dioxygenase-like cupin family protein
VVLDHLIPVVLSFLKSIKHTEHANMKSHIRLSGAVLLLATVTVGAANAQQKVEIKGQSSKIKFSQVISGHLSQLNGKFQLRVSEATFEPGGFVGAHHHVGPGIRCITEGELTYVSSTGTKIYKVGDCFFEPGDVSHTANNATAGLVKFLSFEILPVSLQGSSTVPVPAKSKH